MKENIKEILKTIPHLPGSYQMYDKDGVIIYVGKAKDLYNRVHSYFTGSHNLKTEALVSNIHDIKYMVTKNEREAFLLEISLIKEHHPFYNIDLTDDKTYPYIEWTNEKNPKLIITRHLSKKNNKYFGPYTNVTYARNVLELLNKLYKLRRCSSLPKKECIYYEMKECNAPCIKNISKEEYDKIYKDIKSFLYGNDNTIINLLKLEMEESSKKLDFENAKRCKDLIDEVNETIIRQSIILKEKIDVDVYGISYNEDLVSISRIIIREGKIILKLDRVEPYYFDVEDAITSIISSYYEIEEVPKNIYIEKKYASLIQFDTNIVSPIKGDKAKLLSIALSNSSVSLDNQISKSNDRTRNALLELKDLLGIPLPRVIESFDNSNLFGDDPVSSLVVYVDGKKSKKDYRKYLVKSVEGPNDYETMKEVVYRRYKRLLDENKAMPDLILLDGGEIQIKATLEVLNHLGININVAGMKKNDKHDTDTLIFNGTEYKLDKHKDLYRFLFEIQEEVHRYAITFHRTLKSKNDFNSILDEISGIGATLKGRLLDRYKTIDNIVKASDDELKELGLNNKSIIELREKIVWDKEFE